MTVAPFPTLAREVDRVTSEVWIAFGAPVAHGDLRSHEIAGGAHVIDARDALSRAADLVEVWLATPELSCCAIRIGLQLYVDGALWTAGATDHFWRLGGWVELAESLLDGRPASMVVWDQRLLRSRIEGERATIWDEHVLRFGRFEDGWWPIRCQRLALARAIAQGAAIVDALRSGTIAALETRFDRNRLRWRLDPAQHAPRATELVDKAALVDREVTRNLDPLPLRALRARAGS